MILAASQLKGMYVKGVALVPLQTYSHIAVKDNGIGFDSSHKEKVFEMFKRLHGRTEYSGTGIGLSIVKKIIQNHHGVITASSAINEGTTFDIYLPT